MKSTPLYDTHCHLHDESFDRDRPWVIRRAALRGVKRVLAVSEDLADACRLLTIQERHRDFMAPALGIHPDRAALVSDAEVSEMETLIRRKRDVLCAVGEVGLDHRPCWDAAARGRQEEVFRHMIRLARELRLPLTVHSRGAGRRAIDVLLEEDAGPACLHAFDARAVQGERGAAAGFAFSIGPSIVRSRVKQKLVPRLPPSAILLETDAPVLGPDRRLRNEPGNLAIALKEVARLLRTPLEEAAETIAMNTRRFFPGLVREDPHGDR